jgi:SAM-dependent methyltransferase
MQLPRTQQKQQARSLADNRAALDQIAGKLTPPEIDPPMEKGVDSTHPDFWTSRYATGKTPWDFGGVPAALRSFLVRSSAPGKVLIPGCGSGYEVQAFHEAGYDVTAIDFSPAAVNQANRVLGVLAGRVIFGDFFTHNFEQGGFDLIYERTFLCSMPPSRWPDYANRMADLLSPEGRLVGIFLYGQQADGPPYPLTDKQAEELFQRRFRLVRSELVTDSLPLFRGMERWQEWLKIDPA